jgi:hypothetical protein
MAYRRATGACMILLLSSTGACARALGHASADPSQCTITPERYDTLRIGADPVYVEPDAVESDDEGRLLIMGSNTYRFSRASGEWAMVDERIFGLVFDRDRRVHIVPSPVDAKRFAGMRALPNGRGWSVVFAELADIQPPGRDAAVALWYGEFDGSRWTVVERLPASDTLLSASISSSLSRTATGLVWMAPTRSPRHGVLVLKREGGVWRGEHVTTIAAKVEPLVSPSGDLMLAAIQSDSTLTSDGSSLLLRAERRGWGVVEVLRRSQDEPVSRLESRNWGRVSVLSWGTDLGPSYAVRALVNDGTTRLMVTIDSAASRNTPLAPIDLPQPGPIWVTQHQPSSGSAELQFAWLDRSGGVIRQRAFPSPFVGEFRAAARNGNSLLTGAVLKPDEYVASLVIEYSVRCALARR